MTKSVLSISGSTNVDKKLTENQILDDNNENENDCAVEVDYEQLLPCYSIQDHNWKSNVDKILPIIHDQKLNHIEKNIPLLVKDILQLKITSDNKLSAFGIEFEMVTVYGNWFQNNSIDDGTGSIRVIQSKNLKEFSIEKYETEINNLRLQLNKRIKAAKSTNNKNQIELNSCLNRLLKKSEEEVNNTKIKIQNGSKVYIIGRPFKFKDCGDIAINAIEIKIDNNQNRNKELFFKRDLIRYYTTHYENYKIDGSKKK